MIYHIKVIVTILIVTASTGYLLTTNKVKMTKRDTILLAISLTSTAIFGALIFPDFV